MVAVFSPISRHFDKQFLAGMSSSRSDDVTKSVCLSVCVFSLEHSKYLKEYVLRELQGCLRGVCLKFQRCLEGSRLFQ